jgi:hypothetical protein
MARLPGLPNPLDGLARLGRYAWRDPEYTGRTGIGGPETEPYSGMGLGSFLRDSISGLNPITQAQDTWKYRPQVLGGEKYPGPPLAVMPLGGRWAPRTRGLRAEALQKGDEWIDYVGDRDVFKSAAEAELAPGLVQPGRRGYNLRNEKNEIVASGDAVRGIGKKGRVAKETYAPSVWVREDYRKTGAFNDLINLISHGGKLEVRGEIQNPRLRALMERKTNPERLKTLRAVAKVATPKPKKPTQLDRDIRQLRVEAESGMMGRQQLTNRDIGHPLTPVRRPPPPRPARARIMSLREQQTALGNELRERRRGGV